jgi:hypothetical protein
VKRPRLPSFLVPALAIAGGGLGLYFLLALVEGLLGASPLGSALIEEGAKALLLALLAAWGFRKARERIPRAELSRREFRTAISYAVRHISLGLALILAFATVENLAYFLAFPTGDIFGRLLWSEPVHLVAALAEALGSGAALRILSRGQGRRRLFAAFLRWLPWFLGAIAWHLGANYLAGGLAGEAFRQGPPLLPGALANLIIIILVGRLYVRRLIIGGFLYGTT